jgi:hypothetical protein
VAAGRSAAGAAGAVSSPSRDCAERRRAIARPGRPADETGPLRARWLDDRARVVRTPTPRFERRVRAEFVARIIAIRKPPLRPPPRRRTTPRRAGRGAVAGRTTDARSSSASALFLYYKVSRSLYSAIWASLHRMQLMFSKTIWIIIVTSSEARVPRRVLNVVCETPRTTPAGVARSSLCVPAPPPPHQAR